MECPLLKSVNVEQGKRSLFTAISVHTIQCVCVCVCVRACKMWIHAEIVRFHSFYRPRMPLGKVGIALFYFLDLGTKRGSASRPGRLLPP
jgi:hypothetical protein